MKQILIAPKQNLGIEFSPSLRQHLLRECWLLHERLAAAPKEGKPINPSLLEPWQNVVAPDMPSKLADRLAWSGYTSEQATWAMAPPTEATPQDAPWLPLLEEICQETQLMSERLCDSSFYQQQQYPVNRDNPLAFEDLWLPAISIARCHLVGRVGDVTRLTPSAMLDLEAALLKRLCQISAAALFEPFHRSRPLGIQLLAAVVEITPNPNANEYYQSFIRRQANTGLQELLQTYPLLGRAIATVVMSWIETTAELIHRLEEDWPDLQEKFFPTSAASTVVKIQTSLSDPHRGGRTTSILTFDNGDKVVYKPKDLGLDQAYQMFLDWCNRSLELARPFKTLTVLQRENYGWVEFVAHRPSTTPDQWRTFYDQTGALLAILYLLGASDCHMENLIACDEHLVLIDTETLLQSQVQGLDANQSMETLSDIETQFAESVARIGLLPHWLFMEGNHLTIDISALGSSPVPPIHSHIKALQNLNTNTMGWGFVDPPMETATNLPYIQSGDVNVQDYVENLVAGFGRTYRQLLLHQAALQAPNGPLSIFAQQRMRLVFRATRIYATISRQCLEPEALKSSIAFSLPLEQLTRAYVVSTERPSPWLLLAAEQEDMANQDIPFFEHRSDSADLPLPSGGSVANYFQPHGYRSLIERCSLLSETNLALQQNIIRGTLAAHGTQDTEEQDQIIPANLDPASVLKPPELLTETERIAQELVDHSLQDALGRPYWLGFNYIADPGRMQFAPIGPGLYDGRCGIALFLAALDHIRGTHEYGPFIKTLLDPLVTQILTANERDRWRLVRDWGLGMGGTSGMLYTMAYLHRWQVDLGRTTPLALARLLGTAINDGILSRDLSLDVLGGSAGGILALLPLFNATHEARWLDLAQDCGRHILNQQDPNSSAWKTFAPSPLTGFSHGAAGIAYALLRLYAATGNSEFRLGAIQGLNYETQRFDPQHNNWPDLRASTDRPGFPNQWCHGAAGIGLGRLGCLGLDPELEDTLRGDLDRVFPNLLSMQPTAIDHLCCGNMGRAEVLWTCGQQLAREDLQHRALAIASAMIHRAHQQQHYDLMRLGGGFVYNPGFFQGMAGIGYQLLRFIEPRKLPCVLLLGDKV